MAKSNFNLETNQYLKNCNSKDVISLNSKSLFYIHKLCDLVVSAFDISVARNIANSITNKIGRVCNSQLWLEEGEKCEILKADSTTGWQAGKIKLKIDVTLEFIPDEPELEKSPLDDVREEISSAQ